MGNVGCYYLGCRMFVPIAIGIGFIILAGAIEAKLTMHNIEKSLIH